MVLKIVQDFVNNFDWKNINFSSKCQDYKTLEMNNKSIALHVLHTHSDISREISQYYKSKFNKTREKQVILLIITESQK